MVLIRLRRSDGIIQRYKVKNKKRYVRLPGKKIFRSRTAKEVERLKPETRAELGLRIFRRKVITVKPFKLPKKTFWISGQYSARDKRVVAVRLKARTLSEVRALSDKLGEAEGPTVNLSFSTLKPSAEDTYNWNMRTNELKNVRG